MTFENMKAFEDCENMRDNPERRKTGMTVKKLVDVEKIYQVKRKEFSEPFNYIMKHVSAEVIPHGQEITE